MCFAEPVSSATGTALIVDGVFAGWKAFQINTQYLPVFADADLGRFPTGDGSPCMDGAEWSRWRDDLVGCNWLYLFLLAGLAGGYHSASIFWGHAAADEKARSWGLHWPGLHSA